MKPRTVYAINATRTSLLRLRWGRGSWKPLDKKWVLGVSRYVPAEGGWSEEQLIGYDTAEPLALALASYNRQHINGWRLIEREPDEVINALKGATAHAH